MFQSEGWSLLRPTHHSTRCLSSFELIVSAVRGLGWQGGWELWQFLLDSKARGVVEQARMFCPRCQVVKELWGRAMCPNSQFTLCQMQVIIILFQTVPSSSTFEVPHPFLSQSWNDYHDGSCPTLWTGTTKSPTEEIRPWCHTASFDFYLKLVL